MPLLPIYCQAPECGRLDDAVEYWQCQTCRVVMCRSCWETHTQAKHLIPENPGLPKTLGHAFLHTASWDCPIDGIKTQQYKLFPMEVPKIK